MKIRTQLVLASFLLSVLPLTGIVTYSYYSSRRALEAAYQHEAAKVAQQMDRRLTGIRHDLEQRLAALSGLQGAAGNDSPDVRNVLLTMGDAASIVDAVEIKPVPAPVAAPRVAALAAPAVKADAEADDSAESDESDSATVIDLPPVPPMPPAGMNTEQKRLILRITQLGQKLGQDNSLTLEERHTIEEEIHDTQEQLDASFERSRKEWEASADAARKAVMVQQRARMEAQKQRLEARIGRGHPKSAEAEVAPAAPSEPPAPVIVKRRISDEERERLRSKAKQIALLFGHDFDAPIRKKGAVVAHVSAQVSAEEVIDRVLGAASDDRSEIAFAIDREGNVYARSSAEKQKLRELGIPQRIANHQSLRGIRNWIVVAASDLQSGMRVGVARPVGENFDDLRKTAAKNFGYGIALIFIALIGVVPLANHMTRDVNVVTRGAERVSRGDLTTRVPVKSDNEFGQLAAAFNKMAEDLSLHQQTIVQQEVQQRLLAAEYERKTVDLEDARRFQLSLLPKEVPHLPGYDIAVFTRTATEVGGDYYDFHIDRGLSVTVGDATGHGAKAGTMVTVIKTLFAGYGASMSPSCFLRDAAEKVKRMDLGRMAMALLVSRFDGKRFTVASAGMPPVYVHRASSGEIEEIARGATPLGTLGADYADISIELQAGDTIFLMTDGFPELLNPSGQQLGYSGAVEELREAAQEKTADDVIAALGASAQRWHGEQPPNDDVTFVVIRVA